MADISKTVAIIFEGEDRTTGVIDKLERSLVAMQAAAGKSTAGLGGLARDLETATQPMANLTAGALKFEAGLLAAGAAATIFAVKTAGDFDTAFRQITTLFDASAENVSKFREAILAFAQGSTQPLLSITSALTAAIGSGVDYSKSLELIAVAEKLAVATRADLKGTTEVLVSTLNSYGMKAEDAGKVSDLFFQTIKDGKIEMDQLSHSLAMVTPLAAASGVSLQEVGAAVATLTAAGVQPGQAIEYLRSAISNIIKPSKEAEREAAALGIQFDAAALKSKGLSGVLADVAKATGGNTEKMSKLIGDVGGLTAALTLTGPQAGKFAEILDNMGKSSGSTAEAFAKMGGSLDQATAKVANAFKVLLVEIGTPMLDEFGGIAKAIAKIFDGIGASVKDGALGGLVAYVERMFGDLERTLDRVAKNLPAALESANLSGFTRGIDVVREAFGRLFGAIDLSTVDGLARAIELAGAAFLGLGKFTAGVIDSFKPLFDLLVKMGSELGSANPQFFEMAGNIAGAASQINLLAGGINSMLPAFEALLGLVLLKQGVGLLGAFRELAVALPALAANMGTLGVAVATYFASDRVVALVTALVEWRKATGQLAEAQQQAAKIQQDAIPTLDRFATTTGITVKSIDEANDLVSKGVVVWDEATNGWVKAGAAMEGVGESTKDFVSAARAQIDAAGKQAEAMDLAADKAAKVAAAQGGIVNGVKGVNTIIDAATGKIIGYEQSVASAAAAGGKSDAGFGAVDKALAKNAAEAQKAEEKARAYALELEKLASNERIKLIEARVQLNVAQVQADTERIKAAFSSIDTTIKSTGDLLGSLFGKLDSQGNSFRDQWAIEKQIGIENDRRDEALRLQKDLTKAQIDEMRARTQSLLAGDALIKIDGAGLKPHLEAFMWEILRTIQTRVNRDGLKLLLGT